MTLYSAWHQEKGSFPSSSLVQTSSKYGNNSEGKHHCGVSEGSFREITGMHSGMCSGKARLWRGMQRLWSTAGPPGEAALVRSTAPCSPGGAGPRQGCSFPPAPSTMPFFPVPVFQKDRNLQLSSFPGAPFGAMQVGPAEQGRRC